MTELSTARRSDLAPIQITNPIAQLLQTAVDKGMSASEMKELAALYRDMEANNARIEFHRAFALLQNELPVIHAYRVIPDNNGVVRSKFAALEDILGQIKPCIGKFGFSISFDTECDNERITAICILTHTSGHSENRKFAVRVGGPPKASVAQADGSTLTYAKRLALCNMFNLSIDKDTDARSQGGGDYITAAQAKDLRRRLTAVKGNEQRFLKVAEAQSFETIREDKHGVLLGMLAQKEASDTNQGPRKPWVEWLSDVHEDIILTKPDADMAIFTRVVADFIKSSGQRDEEKITEAQRTKLHAQLRTEYGL